MIEAILWDNDGLLVDSEALFFDLTRKAFERAGYLLDSMYWGVEYLGNAKHSSEIARELGMPSELAGRVIEERNEAFLQCLENPVPLLPDVFQTIGGLSGRVRLGLVTGSPRDKVERMHRDNGLLGYFEVIITDDDIAFPKPHPEPYLKALERLGLEPGKCLAVEDSRRGLASAHAAGIPCVVVPNYLTRIQNFDQAYAVEGRVSGVLKHYDALSLKESDL
ncbi:MAG: HAD family phosphatase [Chlorobium sp.]|jgi:HAD superfamily hydrolase (TIGR01509 family)|uniref:HAD family hydrolase n=1 Tax=Chlorobium sp. TaxID=1095 RepID=UPI0025BF4459|nr:HAD family phosphatase [Chlorobium sp.]MCF8216916.1 HAD family phosphatase [Chlorobium sp.]MCF8271758.1 HAD family phosphatase [Chlorobium sp.]MCF8288133.1 HAD family phosphatase [Chlorobium sp.]MCF8291737.1 HAD family phosphatase [Chlorobium sp.]MCF8385816.1 HAD family phosphatase [Chlorobium sp.]